jgi:ferredoxin
VHEQLHIAVDPDICVGSATCVGTAPHLFELVDGVARARRPAAAADPELDEAFAGCPVAAITADPAEGG